MSFIYSPDSLVFGNESDSDPGLMLVSYLISKQELHPSIHKEHTLMSRLLNVYVETKRINAAKVDKFIGSLAGDRRL